MAQRTFQPAGWYQTQPQFLAADATNRKILAGGDLVNRTVVQFYATNADTIDHTLLLTIHNGSQFNGLGSVVIPANQGYGGTPAVDVLAACVPNPSDGLVVPAGSSLEGAMTVAITDAKQLDLLITGGKG